MNRLFKDFKLGHSYKFAVIAIEIILEDKEEDYIYEINIDDYFISLIVENKEKLLKPNKETLLHIFLGDIFDIYFSNEIYMFRDSRYCDFDLDFIIRFFNNTFISVLEEYGKKIKDINAELESLDSKYENNLINDDQYENKLEEYISYFYNKLDLIRDDVVEEVFYLLFNNKRFLTEFNKRVAMYVNELDRKENNDIFNEYGSAKRCSSLPE